MLHNIISGVPNKSKNASGFPCPPVINSFFQILHPSVTTTPLQVAHVPLVHVRLTLERNVPVRRVRVPVLNQPYKPFNAVPQIEEHVQHLLHLLRVYALVVDVHTANYRVTPYEQDAV